jgi:mRNA-degrading endonuclease toxin of MazEF toxin-antitoxin module
LILHRGEIYRVRLSPAEGREQYGEARPCLVVHRATLRNAGTAIVVPLTTQAPRAGFPLTVHLPAGAGGNPRESWAKITQIRVVAETRFIKPRLGELSEAELGPVKEALRAVLDL